MMKFIKESLDRVSKKPLLCSFYILNGGIYYSTIKHGIEHPTLWRSIVNKSGLFDKLVYENRVDLANAPYCTDRGRVTWKGPMIGDDPDFTSYGIFVLMGTAGCEQYKDKLKSLFGLSGMSPSKLEEDWTSDRGHYKIKKSDEKVLADMTKLLGGRLETKNMHISRLVESIDKNRLIAKVQEKLSKKPEL